MAHSHFSLTSTLNADTKIYTTRDIIKNAKAHVIIVHGLAEHQGRYNVVAQDLNAAGFNVTRFDHLGHGQSDGKRGYIDDFQTLIDDVAVVVNNIKQDFPNEKIFMLGHSMGGFLTAAFGVKYPNVIAGQITSGAAIIELPIFKDLAKIDFNADPFIAVPNSLSALISHDQEVISAYDNDPLVLQETTQKLLGQVFITGAKWLTANLNQYNYPCLILHGADDQIVIPQASKTMFEQIKSTDKNIIIYDSLFHEILNEPERDIVMKDIIAWLNLHC